MAVNDRKSCLSYLNKLVNQYNNRYHHSSNKKPVNPNMWGGGGGGFYPPPPGGFILQYLVIFHKISSCQIWYPLLAPVSRYQKKLRHGYIWFPVTGQSLIKGNRHNSRTSDDIDIKLGSVTKRDKRNKTTSKKLRW